MKKENRNPSGYLAKAHRHILRKRNKLKDELKDQIKIVESLQSKIDSLDRDIFAIEKATA